MCDCEKLQFPQQIKPGFCAQGHLRYFRYFRGPYKGWYCSNPVEPGTKYCKLCLKKHNVQIMRQK